MTENAAVPVAGAEGTENGAAVPPAWRAANDNHGCGDDADHYGDLAHGWDDSSYLMALAEDIATVSPELSAELTVIVDDIASLVREMADLMTELRHLGAR